MDEVVIYKKTKTLKSKRTAIIKRRITFSTLKKKIVKLPDTVLLKYTRFVLRATIYNTYSLKAAKHQTSLKLIITKIVYSDTETASKNCKVNKRQYNKEKCTL